MPASTSISPLSRSNSITRVIPFMSMRVVPVPNCCPPIAWRPPAMLIWCPSLRAVRTTACTPSIESGRATSLTRVGFKCECTSLTITPSVVPVRVALLQAAIAPATPALPASCRKSRRDSISPPDRWPNCGEVSGGLVNHPEPDALNHVVECVVIEINGVDSDAQSLHAGRNQSEREPSDSPGDRPFLPAMVRGHKRKQQKQGRRKIADDGDREISRREHHLRR